MGQKLEAQLWWIRRSKAVASKQLHSGKVHAAAKSFLLRASLQRQDEERSSARSSARRSVVQGSVSRPRGFHLQGSMGRDSQRESNGLCAMGRRRTFPDRLLAICLWQRTSKTQSEQRRRSRCVSRRA